MYHVFPSVCVLEIMSDGSIMNRIAVDIDEVLMPFVKPMAKWRKLTMPTKTKYSYIYSNMFKITNDESSEMVREFYNSETFREIKPFDDSLKAIKLLREQYDKIYIVTGRQSCARDVTEKWIDTHYPGLFDDVILTNSFTNHEVFKSDICTCLDIGTIIDDNDVTCALCKHVGVKPIHFAGYDGVNKYPWCYMNTNSILGWSEILERK